MARPYHFLALIIALFAAAEVSDASKLLDSSSGEVLYIDPLDRQINPKLNLDQCIDIFNTGVPIVPPGPWLEALFQGCLDCAGLDTVDLLGLTTKILVNAFFIAGCNAALAAIPGAAVLSPVLCA